MCTVSVLPPFQANATREPSGENAGVTSSPGKDVNGVNVTGEGAGSCEKGTKYSTSATTANMTIPPIAAPQISCCLCDATNESGVAIAGGENSGGSVLIPTLPRSSWNCTGAMNLYPLRGSVSMNRGL